VQAMRAQPRACVRGAPSAEACYAQAVASLRYAMRSLRSPSFLRPAKIILVPLMYFLGFLRYANSVSSPQVMPA